MPKDVDRAFFDRADAHIDLSNQQVGGDVGRGNVSASMMYATARFNAWVTASGSKSAEEMESARAETLEYFLDQYRKMLNENLDDYIKNFEAYIGR